MHESKECVLCMQKTNELMPCGATVALTMMLIAISGRPVHLNYMHVCRLHVGRQAGPTAPPDLPDLLLQHPLATVE